MATRVFRANPGDQMDASGTTGGVTEAVGAATTKVVEVTVDLAGGYPRDVVLQALMQIEDYMTRVQWPPA